MAKQPRKRKNESAAQPLIDALAFVGIAQSDIGAVEQTHCRFGYKALTAFDGVLAAGIPVETELLCCPHTGRLQKALERCDGVFSLAENANGSLTVSSGKFKAHIPLVRPDELMFVNPDEPIAPITDEVKTALLIASELAKEGAQRVIEASVLLRYGSAIGTNGHVVIEAWHGCDLPTVVLPKSFITALKKVNKPLAQFGFGNSSVTFWFEDGSWLRSQLYNEPWPKTLDEVLACPVPLTPLPEGFYDAVETVSPFTDDNYIRFVAGAVQTHSTADAGATVDLKGAPDGFNANKAYLKLAQPYAAVVAFAKARGDIPAMYFAGGNVRGVIAGVRA